MEVEVCPNFSELGIDCQNQEPNFGESGFDCQNREPNFGELGIDHQNWEHDFGELGVVTKIGIPIHLRKMMESYLMNTPNNFKKSAQNSKSQDFVKCPRRR